MKKLIIIIGLVIYLPMIGQWLQETCSPHPAMPIDQWDAAHTHNDIITELYYSMIW